MTQYQAVDTSELQKHRGQSAPPKPLGPDTYMWENFGSYLYHLMLPQAFILQAAHPVIDAAVSKDKKYKYDPWGRARDSTALLWPVIYARPQEAIAKGVQLRELHREIKGVDKNGNKYHALDPEAYTWVHITGFDSAVRMHQYFDNEPLTAEKRAKLFEEWKQVGAMLGIDDRFIPQTEEQYWEYFNNMIEERLEMGEVLKDLLSPTHFAEYPKPPEARMPDFVWKMVAKPSGWFFHKLTIATLPDNFRKRFGIEFKPRDQRLFRAFAWLVRTLYPLTPKEMRYIPLARTAIRDAEKHPEEYQYNYTNIDNNVVNA